MVGISLRLISAGIVGLAGALAFGVWGKIPNASVSGTSRPTSFDVSASLEREPSFEEHWKAVSLANDFNPAETVTRGLLAWPDKGQRAAARLERSASALTAVASVTPIEAGPESNSLPDADDHQHTAIYDIAAHTVYLPDGSRLEAHSGLGRLLDDPRYANIKDRGATPPNVYELSLREERFHGVRAIRLVPVAGEKTFGRDGLLAHTYLHGPNGESNGCVAFRDYPAFLNAYLNGEINRLLVVERLATTPAARTAARWVPEAVKALVGRS